MDLAQQAEDLLASIEEEKVTRIQTKSEMAQYPTADAAADDIIDQSNMNGLPNTKAASTMHAFHK